MDDKPLLKPEDQLDLDLPKPKVELPADIPSVELA